jgi:hypothetical protein
VISAPCQPLANLGTGDRRRWEREPRTPRRQETGDSRRDRDTSRGGTPGSRHISTPHLGVRMGSLNKPPRHELGQCRCVCLPLADFNPPSACTEDTVQVRYVCFGSKYKWSESEARFLLRPCVYSGLDSPAPRFCSFNGLTSIRCPMYILLPSRGIIAEIVCVLGFCIYRHLRRPFYPVRAAGSLHHHPAPLSPPAPQAEQVPRLPSLCVLRCTSVISGVATA